MFYPKVSIAIPTYEADGRGLIFIKKYVESFKKQTYKNLELVISDHSINDDIKEYLESINDENIIYIKNENDRGLQVENMNNAIHNCSGDFIKLMNHDDYMECPYTIQEGVKRLELGYQWVIYSCKHFNYETEKMYYFHNPRIEGDGTHFLNGLNYAGCSSVGLIPKNVLLDVNVKYMADCELWYRLFTEYKHPAFVGGHKIVIGTGNHTQTNKLAKNKSQMMSDDINYCRVKYEK